MSRLGQHKTAFRMVILITFLIAATALGLYLTNSSSLPVQITTDAAATGSSCECDGLACPRTNCNSCSVNPCICGHAQCSCKGHCSEYE